MNALVLQAIGDIRYEQVYGRTVNGTLHTLRRAGGVLPGETVATRDEGDGSDSCVGVDNRSPRRSRRGHGCNLIDYCGARSGGHPVAGMVVHLRP